MRNVMTAILMGAAVWAGPALADKAEQDENQARQADEMEAPGFDGEVEGDSGLNMELFGGDNDNDDPKSGGVGDKTGHTAQMNDKAKERRRRRVLSLYSSTGRGQFPRRRW